jgi:hypothetical protein
MWRMTDRFGNKKKFLCGINLAALTHKQELAALEWHLEDLLEPDNMKDRYQIGKLLLPSIYKKAYRTYNVKNISGSPLFGRFFALKVTDQDVEMAKQKMADEKEIIDWSELSREEQDKLWDKMSKAQRDKYLEEIVRTRGEDDIEQQEKAKETRSEIEDYVQKLKAQKEIEDFEDDKELEAELEPEREKPQFKVHKGGMTPFGLGPEFTEPTWSHKGLPKKKPEVNINQNAQAGIATPAQIEPQEDEKTANQRRA